MVDPTGLEPALHPPLSGGAIPYIRLRAHNLVGDVRFERTRVAPPGYSRLRLSNYADHPKLGVPEW